MIMRRNQIAILSAVLVLGTLGYVTLLMVSTSVTSTTAISCKLMLVQKILLPPASGLIDHMAFDVAHGQMYIAMLGNNSLAVVDLNAGRFVRSISGLQEPQGVLFLPNANKLFVSNGGNGIVDIFNSSNLELRMSVQLGSDADNMRYDAARGYVYVGYGFGGIAKLNSTTADVINSIGLAGHPESFQLNQYDPRTFVNVPASSYVAVIDRSRDSIVARWPLPMNVSGNFPMALDEAHHRLLIGVRQPSEILVYDTETGRLISTVLVARGPDDMYFNGDKGCLYVSSRQGSLEIIKQSDPDHYALESSIPTGDGAGTSLLVAQIHRLFVAVPQKGSLRAEVLVYQT